MVKMLLSGIREHRDGMHKYKLSTGIDRNGG